MIQLDLEKIFQRSGIRWCGKLEQKFRKKDLKTYYHTTRGAVIPALLNSLNNNVLFIFPACLFPKHNLCFRFLSNSKHINWRTMSVLIMLTRCVFSSYAKVNKIKLSTSFNFFLWFFFIRLPSFLSVFPQSLLRFSHRSLHDGTNRKIRNEFSKRFSSVSLIRGHNAQG